MKVFSLLEKIFLLEFNQNKNILNIFRRKEFEFNSEFQISVYNKNKTTSAFKAPE